MLWKVIQNPPWPQTHPSALDLPQLASLSIPRDNFLFLKGASCHTVIILPMDIDIIKT